MQRKRGNRRIMFKTSDSRMLLFGAIYVAVGALFIGGMMVETGRMTWLRVIYVYLACIGIVSIIGLGVWWIDRGE